MKNYLIILFCIGFVFSVQAVQTQSSIQIFQAYSLNAKKEYALSEKKLIKLGDSYLRQHAFAAERLSLSELLPVKIKDLPMFCKAYPKEISNYYNLGNTGLVKTIKSPVYNEFIKIVEKECQPFIKSKK